VQLPELSSDVQTVETKQRKVTGVDVFIESTLSPKELGDDLTEICGGTTLSLQMIGNRGNTVFPVDEGQNITLVDHYRCRFMKRARGDALSNGEILSLLTKIGEAHTWMHIEKLQQFDNEDAFSRLQR